MIRSRRRQAPSNRGLIAGGVGVLLGALLGWPSTALATTTSVNCATQKLQAKINHAPAGSTLLIKGRCVGNFSVHKSLTLRGKPPSTLDGDQTGTTLRITGSPTIHLIGLTITRGVAPEGGGIRADGGRLTLDHVVVEDNYAIGTDASGGGILFGTGSMKISGSSVIHNVAYSTDTGDSGASGGGIFMTRGPLRITASNLSRNRVTSVSEAGEADVSGGGIVAGGGPPAHISSSHIDSNRAIASGVTAASVTGAGMSVVELSLVRSTVDANDGKASTSGSGGMASAGAGGVLLGDLAAPSTISSSNVRNNRIVAVSARGSAFAGTGGASGAGELIVTRSRVTGNHVEATGSTSATANSGGLREVGDHLSIVSSTMATNTVVARSGTGAAEADSGGFTAGLSASLKRSTVRDNHVAATSSGSDAMATGGGLVAPPGSFIGKASTVSGNTVDATAKGTHTASAHAGGIDLFGTSANDEIINSTIEGNAANGHAATAFAAGGGVESMAGTLTVTNTTVARNHAGERGGGLLVGGGTTTLEATILAANTAPQASGPNCRGTISSAGHNLVGTTAGCSFGAKSSDKVNKDPKLGPLHDNGGPTRTMALLGGSPALNAIPKAACAVKLDQRGVPRPQGSGCDVGAYEKKV